MSGLTESEVRDIAITASREAMKTMLKELGISTRDWQDVQRDFAWLRQQRCLSEQISHWARKAVVTTIVTGLIGIFIFKETFK